MSTVADCPDASTCPGEAHEWTPEPTVIHKPRLCLRGLRSPEAIDRELLRDFADWVACRECSELTEDDLDRYIADRLDG